MKFHWNCTRRDLPAAAAAAAGDAAGLSRNMITDCLYFADLCYASVCTNQLYAAGIYRFPASITAIDAVNNVKQTTAETSGDSQLAEPDS